MGVSIGAGKLNDVPVSPETARFIVACVVVATGLLGGEYVRPESILQAMHMLSATSKEVEPTTGSPLDAVVEELSRIGGI